MHEIVLNKTNITLYQLLKIEAIKRNMSLSAMSKDADIPYFMIFNTSFKRPKLELYEQLSEYLNIDVGDLIDYKIEL